MPGLEEMYDHMAEGKEADAKCNKHDDKSDEKSPFTGQLIFHDQYLHKMSIDGRVIS